jgi:O-methyltransferase involved in polyketide biosynthesis
MTTINLDTSVPNAARIYDYLLGGKDNFQTDRQAGDQIAACIPHAAAAAFQNRQFLGRVVENLAERGIRQFLDIGSGLPTRSSVHQIAQRVDPSCRVVYVDYDAVAVAHAKALLEKGSEEHVTAIGGDLRDPERIIGDARHLLDFSQPVAVLLVAVLHFLPDSDQPHKNVLRLTESLPAGSAIAVSHITAEGIDPERSLAAQKIYQGASAPAVPRTRVETSLFFDGLDLVPPGVTDIGLWPEQIGRTKLPLSFYGGVGMKPESQAPGVAGRDEELKAPEAAILPRRETADVQRVLDGWAASTFRVRQVAAQWGRELLSQPKGTRVESSMAASVRLAADHSTVVRARNLLMGAGIVCKTSEDNRYHVA